MSLELRLVELCPKNETMYGDSAGVNCGSVGGSAPLNRGQGCFFAHLDNFFFALPGGLNGDFWFFSGKFPIFSQKVGTFQKKAVSLYQLTRCPCDSSRRVEGSGPVKPWQPPMRFGHLMRKVPLPALPMQG